MNKVFVSGCFDMLHSGHVRFLEEAAKLGRVHVGIGSDATIAALKGRAPACGQTERKYMLEALKSVASCSVNTGSGRLDFAHDAPFLNADYLVVNHDGYTKAKRDLCAKHCVIFVVLDRLPKRGLPARSTTALRQ